MGYRPITALYLQLANIPTGGIVELEQNCNLEGGGLQRVSVFEAVCYDFSLGHLIQPTELTAVVLVRVE